MSSSHYNKYMDPEYVAANPTLRISYSSRNLLKGCAQKFAFRKYYDHPPRTEEFTANTGTAIHKGFQTWLETGDEEHAVWEFIKTYPVGLGKGWDCDDERSLEACLHTLQCMFKSSVAAEFQLSTIRTVSGLLRPAIEVPFEIEIEDFVLCNGQKVVYTGFIDYIGYSSFRDIYRTIDIKTHRRTLYDLWPLYKFDAQMIPYGLVLQHITGESVIEFDVVYFSAFVDVLEPRIFDYPVRKTAEHLREWHINLILDLQRINKFIELGRFSQTEDGCLSWNKPCAFFQICSDRHDHKKMQRVLLADNPATPLEYEEPWVKFSMPLLTGE